MARKRWATLVAGAVIACASCSPNIGYDDPVPGMRPMFDPATGAIPLPNDVLKNQKTGLLEVPVDETVDSELTKQVKAGINRLDGWLTSSTITIPFEAELDVATLTTDSVRLYDVTGATQTPPVVEAFTADQYYVLFNVGRTPATAAPYNLIIKTRAPGPGKFPAEFKQGHKYIAVVMDGVRDKNGGAVLGHPATELLKSSVPLADEKGRTLTILPDADAALFESVRAALYAPAFTALEETGSLNRKNVVAHTAFSVQSGGRPVFDPTALPAALPTPIDPNSGASVDAALDTKPQVLFDKPYDTTTLPAGIKFYKRGASLTEVSFTTETTSTADANGKYPLRIVPQSLEPSTGYQVVLTDAIKDADGQPTRALAFFSLVAATTPILDSSTTPPTINSPFVDFTMDVLIFLGNDPATATPEQWTTAYTLLTGSVNTLEKWRVFYQPFFADAESQGIARENITVMWTFTTAAQ